MKSPRDLNSALLIFVAASTIALQSSCTRSSPATSHALPEEPEREMGATQISNDAVEWFRKQRSYPFDSFPADARRRAWEALRPVQGYAPQDIGQGWNAIGPHPSDSTFQWGVISGRINAIAVSPADPNVLLIGSTAGGIWRSSDGGGAFVPVSDNQVDLEVGSLAFAPSNPNIVYAGMGDQAGFLLGTGVLRSSDAGQTWTRVDNGSLRKPGMIPGIAVDPGNPNLVYVALFGVFNGNSTPLPGGFYKSSDGGVSWRATLLGYTTDLAMDQNSRKLYLASISGSVNASAGIFQSVDGGDTWNQILPFGFSNGAYQAKVAVAPSNPQTVYAYYGAPNGNQVQVFLKASTDAGATWSSRDLSQVNTFQFGYNTYIAVDPVSPMTVYLGSADVFKSTDGGATWKNLTLNFPTPGNTPVGFQPDKATSHPDQHAIAFSPADSSRIYIGNDGGLWRSNNAGNTFQSLNTTLSLTQFYSVAAHPLDSTISYGGTQDNGLQKGVSSAWKEIGGGDAGNCFNDPLDPSILFGMIPPLSIYRYTANGNRFDKVVATKETFGEPGARVALVAPFTSDGVHDVLYFGTYQLFTSSDRGNTWTAPAGTLDLTRGITSSGADYLSAIGVGPANPQMIYTGSAQGRAMASTNGGATWTDVTQGLPNRHITGITVSRSDSNTAYLTVSGYGSGHVFQTHNGGASWSNITGNLPDLPTNALLVYPSDPNILFIGNDIGVFASTIGGSQWVPFNTGMPPAIVNAFTVRPNGNILAATFGRGVYELAAGIKPPSGPDFSLSFDQDTVNAEAGTKTRITVRINRTGGFTGNVTVTPAFPGSGIKPKPAADITTTDTSVTFKYKIGGGAAGQFQLTFTAKDDLGKTRTATVTLVVQ